MRPLVIANQIVRKYEKHKKLTPFEKDRIRSIVNGIKLFYDDYGSSFIEYIKDNQGDIEAFLNDLDAESKAEVNDILRELEFFRTHTLIDSLKRFVSMEGEVFKYVETVKSISNKYNLPTEFYDESVFKYHHGLIYLPQDIIKSLKNKDFIDCGGYIGGSALIFEKEYHPHKIYSFEPNPFNYELFLENIKTNNMKKVIPILKGVGEKNCILKYVKRGAQTFVYESGNEEMEVVSIDNFVSENNLSLGLIKIDVEGIELDVLKGAKKTIKDFKPVLLIGIYHNPEQFFETKKYIENLIPDYKFKIKHLFDFMPLIETHLIAW